jgi:ribosome-associated heat shock protein Hsp15
MPADIEAVRLDKWLWAARFYKTRSLAAEAIAGGKVHVNNQRAKPGKELKPGMAMTISKSGYQWEITVVTVTHQRRAAKDAELLYEESAESHAKRQLKILEQRENREFFDLDSDHKPNKRDRRLIHQFKQQDV